MRSIESLEKKIESLERFITIFDNEWEDFE